MFDAVTPTSVKMAGAAVLPGRSSDALGHAVSVRRVEGLAAELFGLFGRPAGPRWKFRVGPRLIVTDEAVHVLFGRKIEVVVLPSIAGMAAGATSLVALDVHSEIVEGEARLAHYLGRISGTDPCPVDGLVKLYGGFIVAGKTGLGYFRPGPEALFQDLMARMVGRDPALRPLNHLARLGRAIRLIGLFRLFLRGGRPSANES